MPYRITATHSDIGIESSLKFRNRHQSVDLNAKRIACSGIPLEVKDGNVLISNPEHHCFICGASGMGKSRRLIFPTIDLSARSGHSLFILDPKAEAYRNTANIVRKHGYDVKVINLRTPQCGSRYNPLSLVKKYYDSGFHNKAVAMLNGISTVLFAKFKQDRDKYWVATASDAFVGMALLLLEKKKPLTFRNIHHLVNDFIRNKSHYDSNYHLTGVSEAYRYLSTIASLVADTTLTCILSQFNAALSILAGSPDICDIMASSDFDPADFGNRKTALYCIVPDESPATYIVASLLIEEIYEELVYLADSDESNRLKVPMDFILDEFGSISGTAWTSKLAAARSRGIRFVIAVQTLSQLAALYGDYEAQVLLNNCRTWVFLGGKDYPMMNLLSNLGGSIDGKPVLSISDLNAITVGKPLILDGPKPYIGTLPDWKEWSNCRKAKITDTLREKIPQDHISICQLLKRKKHTGEQYEPHQDQDQLPF